jgi:hypothetical protein
VAYAITLKSVPGPSLQTDTKQTQIARCAWFRLTLKITISIRDTYRLLTTTLTTILLTMLGFITSVTLLAASVVATPIPVYEPPCQGCGKTQTPGYDSTPRTIESGGYTRSFTIQVPSDYDSHGSHPLILDFGKSYVRRTTLNIIS